MNIPSSEIIPSWVDEIEEPEQQIVADVEFIERFRHSGISMGKHC